MTPAEIRRIFPNASDEVVALNSQERASGDDPVRLRDDPVAGLTQLLRESGLVPVFWMCPKGCNGRVVWDKDNLDATCQVCGAKKSDTDCSTIKFTVPVAPMGAPRMTQRDRWAKRPCIIRYHEWRDAVRPHIPENLPKNPSGVSWTAYFPFPKSYSEKKRKALAGTPHREKPDRDNIDKACLDLMFEQDKSVAIGTLQKFWDDGLGPRIEIEVTP